MLAAAAGTFLIVSLGSLTAYVVALVTLLKAPMRSNHIAYRGLIRTAVSRVVVAVLYVGLAVTILSDWVDAGWSSLIVFTAAQICWQTNSWLDVRLRVRLQHDHRWQ